MSGPDWAIDALLAVVLPFLTWRVLVTDEAPKAVVLFIAFGLLSAVSWARLGAPDISLVEAAVGAGLTGALLMGALDWSGTAGLSRRAPSRARRMTIALLSSIVGLAVGSAVFSLPYPSPGLSEEVNDALAPGGVSHPVTAVLLDFRGYDTLLEVVVLMVAAIGARSHGPRTSYAEDPVTSGSLLPTLVHLLLPGIVLVAGYLLWRGSHAPGGAFQAGAILGGGGILLLLGRVIRPPSIASLRSRALLVFGPLFFLIVAAAPMFAGRHLLEYRPESAKTTILAIEATLTVSIGFALMMFYAGASSPRRRAP
jgi:multisubunit Na+/H+ antiporter MnhB subunit